MNQNEKGGIVIVAAIIALLILVGGVGYYLGTQKSSLTLVNQPQEKVAASSKVSPNQTIKAMDWKSLTSKSKGITINYPPTWVASDDQFVSEKPFVPGEQDLSKIYNIIEIRKYLDQLYEGSTNRQSFDKVANLKPGETITDQRSITTKIISGTVSSGEEYVIFKTEPSSTFEGEPAYQIQSFIIKDQTIYQLILNQYDENGINTFQEIIPTATIN